MLYLTLAFITFSSHSLNTIPNSFSKPKKPFTRHKDDNDDDNPNAIPVSTRRPGTSTSTTSTTKSNNGGIIDHASRTRFHDDDRDDVNDEDDEIPRGVVASKSLLDDDEDEEEGDDGFKINVDFATRYQEKKKGEELSKLRDKYGDDWEAALEEDEDEDDDEIEDETGELVTKDIDAKIIKTIGMIRAKNPAVYNPDTTFFSEEDLEKARAAWEAKQEAIRAEGERFTLKDYHRKRLLEDGPEAVGQGLEEDGVEQEKVKTFADEQEEIRLAFKKAAEGLGDDDDEEDEVEQDKEAKKRGGLFTVRDKTREDLEKEEEDYRLFLLENMKGEGAEGLEDWRRFAAGDSNTKNDDEDDDDKIDPNDQFLLSYLLNKGWVDKEFSKKIPTYDEIIRNEHIDVDEEVEEEFERDGDQIMTYAREIDGSMRRKDTRRADARKALNERKQEEKIRKAEELKRLKNLKKEEIRNRLQKIAEVAGFGGVAGDDQDNVGGFDDYEDSGDSGKKSKKNKSKNSKLKLFDKEVDLLEGDFDPDKWDQVMAERFNDEYYNSVDKDPSIKPVFDDDEFGGGDGDDDVEMDDGDYNDGGDVEIGEDGLPKIGNEDDFEIDGVVSSDLGPKAGIGKVRLKEEKPVVFDRLAALAAQEEEEKKRKAEGKKEKKRKREGVEADYYEEEAYPGVENEEDDNFVMDADYLPGGEMYGQDEETGEGSKKKSKKDKKKDRRKKDGAGAKIDSKMTFDQYLEEYYQLDYEDMIGDLPTRFKYRKVEPETFGLQPEEILTAPDAALNELVPLKSIAPFRPSQKIARDKQVWSKTKKKKLSKFKEALKLAEEERKKEEEERKRLKGQAAKKALKRRLAKEGAGGDGGEEQEEEWIASGANAGAVGERQKRSQEEVEGEGEVESGKEGEGEDAAGKEVKVLTEEEKAAKAEKKKLKKERQKEKKAKEGGEVKKDKVLKKVNTGRIGKTDSRGKAFVPRVKGMDAERLASYGITVPEKNNAWKKTKTK
ncbi:hypothetical protein HDU76_005039 [Blyttiomyces sp. JEL0837]|nr:hypothetical protein HDU76_005039 [Blyttiomyces sp. JEL0837]